MIRVMRTLMVLAVLLASATSMVDAQGVIAPYAKLQFLDNSGNPLASGKLYTYAAGTTTPAAVYTDSALTVLHANPVVLDSAGRATIYLPATTSFKFTLKTSADVELWTVDNIIGPFSGVLSITAADVRGLQISRAAADAGLSIASTGGSGKTWGLVSTTLGEFKLRDDADGSPNITIGPGEAITLTTTGTVSMPTSVLSMGGFGTNLFSAGGTGANISRTRNTTAGTGNFAAVDVGNDASALLTRLLATSSTYTPASYLLASGSVVEANGVGGLSIAATDAAGDVRIYTGGSTTPTVSIIETGATTWTSTSPQLLLTESDAAANNKIWDFVASGESLLLRTLTDALSAATIFSVERTGGTVDSFTLAATATGNTGRYNSATLQPGFLAYNSAIDGVATGGTVDFDTEVYDEAGNFAADTFTAPVTGRYHLCATVMFSDNSASTYGLRLVTTARTYQIDWSGGTSAGVSAGCVYADMAAAATASVQVLTGDVDIDIEGGAAPMVTFFSGRLVP